eukprot:9509-Heterococcus_DN1.PRE.2
MTEPIAKRQRTDAAAAVCADGGCEDLERAARVCCLACLHKLVNAEPPLRRSVLETAVEHIADRSSWSYKPDPELDCCGSLNVLLTAAAAAEDTGFKPDLSRGIKETCRMGCLHCTLALLSYTHTHAGDERWSSATNTAVQLKGSDDVLEALLQAAPADKLAELAQRTLVLMCRKHKLDSRSDNEQCEHSNCTAVQRRASLLLSTKGCVTDVSEVTRPWITPLASLAASGCTACVKYFIEQLGAGVTVVSADNSTALHAAASGGHSDVVKLLLCAGADVHAKTTAGNTALHTAVAADKS